MNRLYSFLFVVLLFGCSQSDPALIEKISNLENQVDSLNDELANLQEQTDALVEEFDLLPKTGVIVETKLLEKSKSGHINRGNKEYQFENEDYDSLIISGCKVRFRSVRRSCRSGQCLVEPGTIEYIPNGCP